MGGWDEAAVGREEAVAFVTANPRTHRQPGDGGGVDVRLGKDGGGCGGDDVGGRERLDEGDRLDIADIVIVAAIAPGPMTGDFEDGELLAGQQLGGRLAITSRRGVDEGAMGSAASDEGTGIMRSEEVAGQGDVGKIPAIGVDAVIESQRGLGEAEALSCAGG